jgi:hypothetical protein
MKLNTFKEQVVVAVGPAIIAAIARVIYQVFK